MTTQEVIDYYTGLLILQYRALGNATAHVAAWAKRFLQNQITSLVLNGFDVTTAIGAQLNLLGLYRGVPRTIFGIVAANDWSLIPYADAAPNSYFGWGIYAVGIPTDLWLQYADLNGLPYVLTDAQMRLMIELQAAFQSYDGTLGNLDNILYSFFGVYVNVVDNEDMTITYRHTAADPDPNLLWKMVSIFGNLPHGAGVSFSILEV